MKRMIPLMIVGLLLTRQGIAGEKEQEVPLSEIPKAVMTTVMRALPGLIIQEAEKEMEQGQVVYEIEGRLNGVEYEIEVAENGQLLEVEKGNDNMP